MTVENLEQIMRKESLVNVPLTGPIGGKWDWGKQRITSLTLNGIKRSKKREILLIGLKDGRFWRVKITHVDMGPGTLMTGSPSFRIRAQVRKLKNGNSNVLIIYQHQTDNVETKNKLRSVYKKKFVSISGTSSPENSDESPNAIYLTQQTSVFF